MPYKQKHRQRLIRAREIIGARVFVYGKGTGFHTLNTFVLGKFGISISGIIDKRYDYPLFVESILHANTSHYIRNDIFNHDDVIIISLGSIKLFEEVKKQLSDLTSARIIWGMDIMEYHLSHCDPTFLDSVENFLKANEDQIIAVRNSLDDEKSKIVFDGVMEYFSGCEIPTTLIPFEPLSTQYFPIDFSLPRGNARFINGGSYDGDTLRSMIDNCGRLGDTTICFEPDLLNFGRLTECVSKLPASIKGNVFCLPLGLGEISQKLKFRSGSLVNSSIDPTGPEELTVVSIDQALPNFDPTFISMDIEGAEEQALRGAIKTIRKSKPDLAICIYHSPHQFLAVPIFLLNLGLGYKFRLRNYTGFPAETVLYATASDFIK
jgi:FkbM family methyltransferase